MIAFAEYLLKVLICSALFTGYYWVALRNKLFHQWNRFYLLGAVVLSTTIPFAKFTIWQKTEQPTVAYQVLQNITTEEKWFEEETVIAPAEQVYLTKETVILVIYSLISVCMLLLMVVFIVRIMKLFRRYPHWKLNGLTFVDTEAKGTPFSFLHFIFWNRKIDFESAEGQQIFSHELVHVQEKHSWDKLFMNLVLVFFWVNPFFWLMKKELTMIHEFIADKKAVANGDTSAFAAMILAAAFPGQTLSLTNPFFYSPIKRRLLMLSKLNNPKVGYISRLLLLPLLAFLFAAFVLKTKSKTGNLPVTSLDRTYVVAIDAGHGLLNGSMQGAKAEDGYSEDEFTLALAKAVLEINKNEKIKIVLTRKDEQFIDLKNRSELVNNVKADLMISLHANYVPVSRSGSTSIQEQKRGIEAYIPTKNTAFSKENSELAEKLLNEISSVLNPNLGVKTRAQGIWIIEQSKCPSVLLECGFLSNKNDLLLMKDKYKQEKMAEAILRGIEIYLMSAQRKGASQQSSDSEPVSGKVSLYNQQKDTVPYKISSNNDIISNTDEEPEFIGGSKAFTEYCKSYLEKYYDELVNDKMSRNNSCLVQFIVEKDGRVSNIKILTNTRSKLASYCIELLKSSSNWRPAIENNQKVSKLITRDIPFFDKYFTASLNEKIAKQEHEENDFGFLDKYEYFLIDGKEVKKEDVKALLAKKEKKELSINAFDGQSGKIRYGEKGKNGVIEIVTKLGKPTVAISSEKLNILYAEVENPLKIAVSDVPDQQLTVSISQGRIEKRGNSYIAKNLTPGEVVITVTYNYKRNESLTDEIRYKVIPTTENISYTPIASVAGLKGGRIEAAKFKASNKIDVSSIADADAIVKSFTIYFTGKGFEKSPAYISLLGNSFNESVQVLLEKAGPGTTIVIDEIKVQTKQGDTRAPTIAFNLY